MRKVKPKLNLTSQTARIVNLSHDGRGIARVNGKATFIQGALPGEMVEFQYTRVKRILMKVNYYQLSSPLLSGLNQNALIIKCVEAVLCNI